MMAVYRNRHSKGPWLRRVSLALIAALAAQEVAWAAPSVSWPSAEGSVSSAPQIPSRLGTRRSLRVHGDTDRMLVHIEDAHDSLEAQKRIGSILDLLSSEYQLRSVAIEGASGEIDTDLFKTYPDQEAARRAGERLMGQGRLGAGEFFALFSEQPVKVYGAEDRTLYRENLRAFRALLRSGEQVQKDLDGLRKTIDILFERCQGRALRQLRGIRARDMQTDGFTRRWQALTETAAAEGLPPAASGNLKLLTEMSELERSIDFHAANRERSQLLSSLKDRLAPAESDELLMRSLRYRAGRESDGTYHLYLADLAREHGIPAEGSEHLVRYMRYAALFERIDLAGVLGEADAYERALERGLARSAEEKVLLGFERRMRILSDIVRGRASSEDLRYFRTHRASFDPKRISTLLERFTRRYRTPLYGGLDIDRLGTVLPLAERFYELARRRDEALAANALEKMRASGTRTAALVTGGFHTPGISGALEGEDLSYLVITPRISDPAAKRPYITIITRRPGPRLKEIASETSRYQIAVGNRLLDLGRANDSEPAEDLRILMRPLAEELLRSSDPRGTAERWMRGYEDAYAARKLRRPDVSPQRVRKTLGELTGLSLYVPAPVSPEPHELARFFQQPKDRPQGEKTDQIRHVVERLWSVPEYADLKRLILKYKDVPGMGTLLSRMARVEQDGQFREIAGELFAADHVSGRFPGAELLALNVYLGGFEVDAVFRITGNPEMQDGYYVIEAKETLHAMVDSLIEQTREGQVQDQVHAARRLRRLGVPVNHLIVVGGPNLAVPSAAGPRRQSANNGTPVYSITANFHVLAGTGSGTLEKPSDPQMVLWDAEETSLIRILRPLVPELREEQVFEREIERERQASERVRQMIARARVVQRPLAAPAPGVTARKFLPEAKVWAGRFRQAKVIRNDFQATQEALSQIDAYLREKLRDGSLRQEAAAELDRRFQRSASEAWAWLLTQNASSSPTDGTIPAADGPGGSGARLAASKALHFVSQLLDHATLVDPYRFTLADLVDNGVEFSEQGLAEAIGLGFVKHRPDSGLYRISDLGWLADLMSGTRVSMTLLAGPGSAAEPQTAVGQARDRLRLALDLLDSNEIPAHRRMVVTMDFLLSTMAEIRHAALERPQGSFDRALLEVDLGDLTLFAHEFMLRQLARSIRALKEHPDEAKRLRQVYRILDAEGFDEAISRYPELPSAARDQMRAAVVEARSQMIHVFRHLIRDLDREDAARRALIGGIRHVEDVQEYSDTSYVLALKSLQVLLLVAQEPPSGARLAFWTQPADPPSIRQTYDLDTYVPYPSAPKLFIVHATEAFDKKQTARRAIEDLVGRAGAKNSVNILIGNELFDDDQRQAHPFRHWTGSRSYVPASVPVFKDSPDESKDAERKWLMQAVLTAEEIILVGGGCLACHYAWFEDVIKERTRRGLKTTLHIPRDAVYAISGTETRALRGSDFLKSRYVGLLKELTASGREKEKPDNWAAGLFGSLWNAIASGVGIRTGDEDLSFAVYDSGRLIGANSRDPQVIVSLWDSMPDWQERSGARLSSDDALYLAAAAVAVVALPLAVWALRVLLGRWVRRRAEDSSRFSEVRRQAGLLADYSKKVEADLRVSLERTEPDRHASDLLARLIEFNKVLGADLIPRLSDGGQDAAATALERLYELSDALRAASARVGAEPSAEPLRQALDEVDRMLLPWFRRTAERWILAAERDIAWRMQLHLSLAKLREALPVLERLPYEGVPQGPLLADRLRLLTIEPLEVFQRWTSFGGPLGEISAPQVGPAISHLAELRLNLDQDAAIPSRERALLLDAHEGLLTSALERLEDLQSRLGQGARLSMGMGMSMGFHMVQRVEMTMQQKAEMRMRVGLMMLMAQVESPGPAEAVTGSDGLLKADAILKERGAVGIVVGSTAKHLWNRAATDDILKQRKDIDVLVLSKAFELKEPFEGGIDWFLPVTRWISHTDDFSSMDKIVGLYVNGNDVFLRAGVSMSDMDYGLKPGLYLPSRDFLIGLTQAVVEAGINERVVTIDEDTHRAFRERLEKDLRKGVSPVWTRNFGGKTKILGQVVPEYAIEIERFPYWIRTAVLNSTPFKDVGGRQHEEALIAMQQRGSDSSGARLARSLRIETEDRLPDFARSILAGYRTGTTGVFNKFSGQNRYVAETPVAGDVQDYLGSLLDEEPSIRAIVDVGTGDGIALSRLAEKVRGSWIGRGISLWGYDLQMGLVVIEHKKLGIAVVMENGQRVEVWDPRFNRLRELNSSDDRELRGRFLDIFRRNQKKLSDPRYRRRLAFSTEALKVTDPVHPDVTLHLIKVLHKDAARQASSKGANLHFLQGDALEPTALDAVEPLAGAKPGIILTANMLGTMARKDLDVLRSAYLEGYLPFEDYEEAQRDASITYYDKEKTEQVLRNLGGALQEGGFLVIMNSQDGAHEYLTYRRRGGFLEYHGHRGAPRVEALMAAGGAGYEPRFSLAGARLAQEPVVIGVTTSTARSAVEDAITAHAGRVRVVEIEAGLSAAEKLAALEAEGGTYSIFIDDEDPNAEAKTALLRHLAGQLAEADLAAHPVLGLVLSGRTELSDLTEAQRRSARDEVLRLLPAVAPKRFDEPRPLSDEQALTALRLHVFHPSFGWSLERLAVIDASAPRAAVHSLGTVLQDPFFFETLDDRDRKLAGRMTLHDYVALPEDADVRTLLGARYERFEERFPDSRRLDHSASLKGMREGLLSRASSLGVIYSPQNVLFVDREEGQSFFQEEGVSGVKLLLARGRYAPALDKVVVEILARGDSQEPLWIRGLTRRGDLFIFAPIIPIDFAKHFERYYRLLTTTAASA